MDYVHTLDDLRTALLSCRLVTDEQWTACAKQAADPRDALDRLESLPAWWNPDEPAITRHQRRCINRQLRVPRGLAALERDLCLLEYLILDKIGEGGMATVDRAVSLDTREIVALKRPLSNERYKVSRLQREAKILERLDDPRIPAFVAYERDAGRDSYVLVMEYLPGETLHERIDPKRSQPEPLNIGMSERILIDLLKTLEHAHNRDVIHRDVTPRNIIVNGSGDDLTVKLLDFGLGRDTDSQSASSDPVTRTGAAIGTYAYMSPEQFEDSKRATAASDLYNLGCTAYFMLTGEPPFRKTDFSALLLAHRNDSPPSLREARPDVPEYMARAIRRMLAKSPDKRGAIPELIAMLRGRDSETTDAPKSVVVRNPSQASRSPESAHPGSADAQESTTATGPARRTGPPVSHQPLENPATGWLYNLVPPSELAAAARFIDPEPSPTDVVFRLVSPQNLVKTLIALVALAYLLKMLLDG